MHAEVTKHVLLGCKYLSCPAAVCAGVGTIWEVSKLGGLNIKECLQPRKYAPRKIVFAGRSGESRPTPVWGKADDREKEPGRRPLWDPPWYGTRHPRKDSQR